MKTILYVSLTANGRFGQSDGGAHAIPPQILADFLGLVQQSRNVIIGRRTHDLLGAQPGFAQVMTGIDIVVVSGHLTATDGATVATSPKAALQVLGDRAFTTAVVGGGAQLDGAFLSEGLVDELYVNIMPSVIGSSPALPVTEATALTLRMIDTKHLTDDLLQLHYAVER